MGNYRLQGAEEVAGGEHCTSPIALHAYVRLPWNMMALDTPPILVY
jgi:hypothetical protein